MYFHDVFFRTDGARTAQPDAAESDATQLPEEDDGEPGDPAPDLEPPPRAVPEGRLHLHLLHGLRGRGQPHPDQVQDPIRHLPQVRPVKFFLAQVILQWRIYVDEFLTLPHSRPNFLHSVTVSSFLSLVLSRTQCKYLNHSSHKFFCSFSGLHTQTFN